MIFAILLISMFGLLSGVPIYLEEDEGQTSIWEKRSTLPLFPCDTVPMLQNDAAEELDIAKCQNGGKCIAVLPPKGSGVTIMGTYCICPDEYKGRLCEKSRKR